MDIPVKLPRSLWLDNAFRYVIEDSFPRESERIALEEECEFGEFGLDAEEAEDILRELADEDAIVDAAEANYAAAFRDAATKRAKFGLNLRPSDPKAPLSCVIARDAALRLVGAKTLDEDDLASEVECLFKEWIEKEDFKLGILDHVGSCTDALICDKLIKR